MNTRVPGDAIAALRGAMRGDVVTPDDTGYDEARKVWNGDIDRRPAVIARCTTTADVRAALAFGRANRLPIAIKGGGHSLPGHSTGDGVLVIDLRPMNAVAIDPAGRRATVQGGAIWSEVDQAAQAHGLAVTGGHVSHTGVGGLTVGGGVGHLHRKLGLTIDNLISARVVTADGRELAASAAENADLFWAIRGGGGNFGIATEFVFKLTPVGPTVLGGRAFWAPERGPELMRRYRELCKNCPDELTALLAYMHAPPFDFVPKAVQLTPGYALVTAGTDVEIAARAVAEIRSFGPPLFDVIGPMPYLALQTMIDPALPPGIKAYLKAHYVDEFSDEVIQTFHHQTAKMPPGFSQMITIQMGGAIARVPDELTAFGGRSRGFQTLFIGVWQDDAQRPACVQWARGFWEAVEPHSKGVYVNLADTLDESSLKVTYGAQKFARLQQIKAKYDPENVFRLNQNIAPARRLLRAPAPGHRPVGRGQAYQRRRH